MNRIDGRKENQIRDFKITKDYTMHPDGCVLVECGNTKVICSAFIEERVPPFLRGENKGWVSSEYSMLPSSTKTRKRRDISSLKIDGRSSEIQRLIGRSLRACVDLQALGERSVIIDCDVIQADGGTRVASISGAFVALYIALEKLVEEKVIETMPIKFFIAAISAGVVENEPLLDLCYEEDSSAMADMNIVMNESLEIIEIGCSSEGKTVTEQEFNKLMEYGKKGVGDIIKIQKEVLGVI